MPDGSWLAVLDGDDVSKRQKDHLLRLKPIGVVQGMLECDKQQNLNAQVCSKVEYFPAFCHVESNACVYGIRSTTSEMDELKRATPK